MKKIGFIGLGIMGTPMVKNLIKNGVEVNVYDINPKAVKEISKCGAKGCKTNLEVAKNSDIVFTMVPDGHHVKEVIFGKDGLLKGLKKGKLVVDLSSIAPIVSIEIYNELKKIGVGFIDCPVSGGQVKAIDGTLAFMAGGDKKDFEVAKPYMEMMGSTIILVGKSGSGTGCKLANQIIVNLNIAAVGEALTLMAKMGIDPNNVYNAIRSGLAGSTVLDNKAPLMINGEYEKGGGRIDINTKDIKNVLLTSKEYNCSLPLTAELNEMFKVLNNNGWSKLDHSAIAKYYELINNVTIKK